MSSNVGTTYNNPGNLTVNAPGQILYAGQSSTYSSPNGHVFAVFPDATTGYNALVSYIQRHVASGASTVSQLVNLFDPGDLNTFVSTTGLSPSSSLVGVDPGLVAQGIAAAEGTTSILPNNVVASNTAGSTTVPAQNITDPSYWTNLIGTALGAVTNPAGTAATVATNVASGQNPLANTNPITGPNLWLIGGIAVAGIIGIIAIMSAFSGGNSGSKTTVIPIPV